MKGMMHPILSLEVSPFKKWPNYNSFLDQQQLRNPVEENQPYINTLYHSYLFYMLKVQWNPSCEANPFAPEKWPFKRGGLSSVKINTFMFRFTLSNGLSRGVGLSSGWPLKRGSAV